MPRNKKCKEDNLTRTIGRNMIDFSNQLHKKTKD